MKNPAQAALLLLLLLAAGTGVYLWTSGSQAGARANARIQALEKEKASLAEHHAALESQNAALRQQLAERGIEPVVVTPVPKSDADGKRLEMVRELAQVQAKLTAVNAANTELQNRVQELEAVTEKSNADNRRLATTEAGLREDLDSARRVVQAMEAELKAKSERLAQMEITLRKTRDEQAAAAQRGNQAGALANELSDINRRRENTVTTLQRRYRELTDQLRALAIRLDRERDNPVAAAPDISRIQTAVQSAEDDLRQLSGLNAQAQRVAQKLNQK
jgi:DNA repair exonuclease SbcCD ATPase subunit